MKFQEIDATPWLSGASSLKRLGDMSARGAYQPWYYVINADENIPRSSVPQPGQLSRVLPYATLPFALLTIRIH